MRYNSSYRVCWLLSNESCLYLTLALVSIGIRGGSPRLVVEKWQTFLAVNAVRVVSAFTLVLFLKIVVLERRALVGVTITLASATDRYIADGIEVRSQNDGIVENFVTKGVKAIKGDKDVRGRDPVFENWTALELIGARSAFQSTESH